MDNQQQDYERIVELIEKSIANNHEPNDELIDLISKNSHSDELIKNISSKEFFCEKNRMINEAYVARNVDKLLRKIDRKNSVDRRNRILKITIPSAVAVLVAVSFLFNSPRIVETPIAAECLSPTLIVGAKMIALNNSKTNVVSYNEPQDADSTMKRLIVPAGNRHIVVLEDSSEVTLNASSELIYSSFNGNTREVILKGEAYFNVKKSDKPFIVKIEDCYIMVYGTEFNINAYNRSSIKTVLVSGSVGVGGEGLTEAKITPNQMIELDLVNKTQQVKDVDVSPYISWMNGDLEFINEEFNTIILELERWYNVGFEYNIADFNDCRISFVINRQKPLIEVIELIENITKVKFTNKNEKGGVYKIERN